MDPRLEFVFQLLMDGTELPRHQIMDHIFEGDMVKNIHIDIDTHNFSTTIEIYRQHSSFLLKSTQKIYLLVNASTSRKRKHYFEWARSIYKHRGKTVLGRRKKKSN